MLHVNISTFALINNASVSRLGQNSDETGNLKTWQGAGTDTAAFATIFLTVQSNSRIFFLGISHINMLVSQR
jgi:hypothetical protein